VDELDENDYGTRSSVGLEDKSVDLNVPTHNHLESGSTYKLIRPTDGIHKFITKRDESSILLHLSGNDVRI
jgi:hypothetical protein